MAAGGFLVKLIIISGGLLAVAVGVSTGEGGAPGSSAISSIATLWSGVAGIAGPVAGSEASGPGQRFSLVIAFLAGWWLRWLYSLPWAAIPRAIHEWMLGWRASAAMAGLAAACTVILLFY